MEGAFTHVKVWSNTVWAKDVADPSRISIADRRQCYDLANITPV